MVDRSHWDEVYRRKGPDQVSWYKPHLDQSLSFIEQLGLPREAPIIDVGGGASTLVDDLLARGHTDVTVLDISAEAMKPAQARLKDSAQRVQWMVADITVAQLPAGHYAFWHDRAVFHFLREDAERLRYVEQARRALKPGGYIMVGAFGPEGPEKCSGLEVVRYSADGIHEEFGRGFQALKTLSERHQTPWGSEQQFVYCCCKTQP